MAIAKLIMTKSTLALHLGGNNDNCTCTTKANVKAAQSQNHLGFSPALRSLDTLQAVVIILVSGQSDYSCIKPFAVPIKYQVLIGFYRCRKRCTSQQQVTHMVFSIFVWKKSKRNSTEKCCRLPVKWGYFAQVVGLQEWPSNSHHDTHYVYYKMWWYNNALHLAWGHPNSPQ